MTQKKQVLCDLRTLFLILNCQTPEYKFCEVEIDESEILAQSYGIDIVPAFLFFHNGQLLAGFSGLIDTDVLETRLHKIFRNC